MIAWSIGRANDNSVVLNEQNISSYHAVLKQYEGNRLVIEDKDSENGVWVNGRRVESCLVSEENKIEFGSFHFKLDRFFWYYEGVIIGPKDPDDYSHIFPDLVSIEKSYEKEVEKINRDTGRNMIYFRILIVFVPVFLILSRNEKIAFLNQEFLLGMAITFGLLATYFYAKAMTAGTKKNRKIKEAHANFKDKFVCPSCSRYLSDNIAFMQLKESYQCPACKVLLFKKKVAKY
jgi:rubredoxin